MAAYTRISLATIKDRLDFRTAAVFWTEQEWQDAINEAIRIWQLMTGEWSIVVDLGSSAGSLHTYQVPKQIASTLRVRWNGTALTLASLPELDYGQPGWQGTSGTPLYWLPAGVNIVDIVPYPTSGTLSFEGFQEPPILRADGDFINIGDEALTKLLGYCRHYLSIKEGTSEFKATQEAIAQLAEAAGKRNAGFRASAPYRKFMGIYREEGLRPSQVGPDTKGARS